MKPSTPYIGCLGCKLPSVENSEGIDQSEISPIDISKGIEWETQLTEVNTAKKGDRRVFGGEAARGLKDFNASDTYSYWLSTILPKLHFH